MSVVIVKIYDDKIIVAADSQGTLETENIDHEEGNIKKLVRIDDVVIGAVGDLYEAQRLFHYFKTEHPQLLSQDDLQQFIYSFIEYKKRGYGFFDRIKKRLVFKPKLESSYIFIFNNQCYVIEETVIFEVSHMYAIGSGWREAYAALRAGMTPKEAVNMVCQYNTTVSLPVVNVTYYKKC